jgi:2-keto-4-pentenoate hydratase/2-oxohepta-3-ene-1,7-dioic acid hydratase in catechol pathway
MRIASYIAKGAPSYGAVTADGIIDLKKRLGDKFEDVRSLIACDGLSAAQAAVASQRPDYSVDEVALLSPVPDPEKLWCIGVNYRDRNAEYKDNSDLPQYPSLFVRNPSSVVGSGQPIEKPQVSDQLDYEGELVLVIGKEGRHIPRERAFEHIFGMTLCNEGTVRDWLRHGKFNVTQGKNFDRSGSIGPWIVTSDELDPRGPHDIIARVRHADRRGRALQSAPLVEGRRCRGGRVLRHRRTAQCGRGREGLKPVLNRKTIDQLAERLDEAERTRTLSSGRTGVMSNENNTARCAGRIAPQPFRSGTHR